MKPLGILAVFLIFLGLLVLGPLLTIWALNILFHLGIPYTLQTWAAVVCLGGSIRGLSYTKKE